MKSGQAQDCKSQTFGTQMNFSEEKETCLKKQILDHSKE
jgi:hypothetical protein